MLHPLHSELTGRGKVCMEVNQLPTKVGPYYWRESDGDKWEIHTVFIDYEMNNTLMAFCQMDETWYAVENWGGQWLPIPSADELVELQAKAKAYDDGKKLWVSFDVETEEPYAIDRDPAITIHDTWKLLGRHPQGNMPGGFVNSKVRVCKEVVG